ncbi:MAG: hypothetical protein LBT09_14850 [Planctomycetaceae bacterium]|nr:hypothetical protein [Planctomycetaceae bacterium]
MLSLSVSIYASEIRDWQTVDGKEYKGALLLLTDDGNVQIYNDNSHTTLILPFKSLCDEDQEYVKGHSNPFQIDDADAKKKESEKKFVKIDWSTPIEVIMVDAERGNADAWAYLGFCYETASKGLNYDSNNAR